MNARGEVVGINTAVIPWAQGMGFAVSARTATWVTSVLMARGKVERRYLGVAARSEQLSPELAASTGQPKAVRILQVGSGSPGGDGRAPPGGPAPRRARRGGGQRRRHPPV